MYKKEDLKYVAAFAAAICVQVFRFEKIVNINGNFSEIKKNNKNK